MAERVYFDTVAFRLIGKAFEQEKLSADLRERVLVSPLTAFEVLSQLSITNGNEVLRQVHAIHNWINPEHAGMLPWPSEMLFSIWFGRPAPDDGFTKRMETAFNVCLAAVTVESLQGEAGKLKDVMDHMKDHATRDFERLMEAARKEPLEGTKFSEAWFRGIANRIKTDPTSKPMAEIVEALNAYHEFERAKLQIAMQRKDYNPGKHKNDLLDAEQLIYLADQSLRFLTCDNGIERLVGKSPQTTRIITVPPADLADAARVDRLLRTITRIART